MFSVPIYHYINECFVTCNDILLSSFLFLLSGAGWDGAAPPVTGADLPVAGSAIDTIPPVSGGDAEWV